MSKSIMHSKDDRTCYLCMKLHNDYQKRSFLQEHHVVFGGFGSGRRLSEKFGLKVYLCDEHHEHSDEAVHNNSDIRNMLCQEAQRAFEKAYPNLSFSEVFGKNYTDKTQEGSRPKEEWGFFPIEDILDD